VGGRRFPLCNRKFVKERRGLCRSSAGSQATNCSSGVPPVGNGFGPGWENLKKAAQGFAGTHEGGEIRTKSGGFENTRSNPNLFK